MIISRYLFREITTILLALTTLLILIYISHRFMYYLIKASTGALPAEFIFKLLGVKLLSDLMLILPLGFFLSVLLALGRLYKDNEVTALAACGIPIPSRSIFFFSVIFAFIVGSLSLSLAPWAERQADILIAQADATAEMSNITAGRFKEFQHGNGIFYVENIDENNNMQYVFIQANLPHKRIILIADDGYQTVQNGEAFIVLLNGHRYENEHNSLAYTITHFKEHSIKMPKRLDVGAQQEKQEALPTATLLKMHEPVYQAELQWRISLPLSIILLAALAIPLSYTTPRQGQYAKIFVGVLIYLLYNNLLNVAQKWVENGNVPIWLGMWWVHGILLALVIILFTYPNIKLWYRRSKHTQLATKRS